MFNQEFVCIPVVKKAVCKWGNKCFHETLHTTRYLDFASQEMKDIPRDACIFGEPRVVEACEEAIGQDPTHKCVQIKVSYKVHVMLQINNTNVPIGLAILDVTNKHLMVPVFPVQNVLCFDPCPQEGVIRKRIHVFRARIVPLNNVGRLDVFVEKEYTAFKFGKAIVCEKACPIDKCEPIPSFPECPEFNRPTECPEWCEDVDNNCNVCPPPQTSSP